MACTSKHIKIIMQRHWLACKEAPLRKGKLPTWSMISKTSPVKRHNFMMPSRALPELTSKRSSTKRWNSKWRCLRTLSENTSITMQCVSLLYQLRNSKKTKKTKSWKRKWRSSSKLLTEDTQKLWVTTWLTSCSTLWASKTEKLCSHRHQSSTATFLPWIYSPYNLLSLKPMTMSSMATADLWLY